VTGYKDKAHFIEAMQAGADDYLTKPVDLDQLVTRLEVARRAVTLRRDGDAKHTALRRKSDRNFRAARTDPLTAVSNRLELAENLAGRAARVDHGHTCCAALCDRVSRDLARAIAGGGGRRHGSGAARGGDLHVLDAPDARVPFVTISVGIAELNPSSTGGIEDWLRRADTALYSAKAEGRNRVAVERPRGGQRT
jgi:PleD family two-component response regulator